MKKLTKKYTFTGAGTEIPAFNVAHSYEYYILTGSVTSIGNYALTYTGSPAEGDCFVIKYRGAVDITTNSNTFTVFGVSLTQNQLNSKLNIFIYYDATSAGWNVLINPSFDQAIVASANIINSSVTNTDLAVMPTMTVKANITGGSTNPQDVTISNFLANNAWKTDGNAGLTAGTNFLGTTDNVDLVFKANNLESGRINIVRGSTSFGALALSSNTTGAYNVAIGDTAMIDNTTGGNNTAVGFAALNANIAASNNTAIGFAALTTNSTGAQNTAVGLQSLNLNTSGTYNTAIGVSSLLSNTIGTDNIGVGRAAGAVITTGSYNIAIGSQSGGTVTTGSNNTLIGANASASAPGALNQIALGYNAVATADYQFIIPTNITTVEFGNSQLTSGTAIQKRNTVAINATATATAAQVKTGYITSTSAAPTTITLPTGTLLGTELGASQGTIHDLYIDNTAGASTVTIAVAVNGILSALAAANAGSFGLLTVPAGITGQACFRLMFSSATAYTFSRIS